MADEINSVSDLTGKTLTDVTSFGGELRFTLDDGRQFHLYHDQDCCEHVSIEDIAGDLKDLVGSPLTMAEEATNEPEPPTPDHADESYTWTFYKFATVKGYVTVRWFGTSNGYYSERVSFGPVGT